MVKLSCQNFTAKYIINMNIMLTLIEYHFGLCLKIKIVFL